MTDPTRALVERMKLALKIGLHPEMDLIREAATALETLAARVEELERDQIEWRSIDPSLLAESDALRQQRDDRNDEIRGLIEELAEARAQALADRAFQNENVRLAADLADRTLANDQLFSQGEKMYKDREVAIQELRRVTQEMAVATVRADQAERELAFAREEIATLRKFYGEEPTRAAGKEEG